MRNVLSLAHEVVLHLHDGRVLFGTIVSESDPGTDSLVLRPWGRASTMTLRFDEVSRASPVRGMHWHQEQKICADQLAAERRDAETFADRLAPCESKSRQPP